MTSLITRISRRIDDINYYKALPSRIKWVLKRAYHEKFLFKFASKEFIFNSIWSSNYWGNKESLSGPGSTLEYTKNIRQELPKIFSEFKIQTIFDAPSGDLNWMKDVIRNTGINYIGGDIVKGIVERNEAAFSAPNFKVIVFDITNQAFPVADLWLCRDVLFHFSYSDILKSLKQYAESNIPYFLTTTYKYRKEFENHDITTGDFRDIDLFQEPFNFSESEVLYRFDDYVEPGTPREMCLFNKDHISKILPELEDKIKKLRI